MKRSNKPIPKLEPRKIREEEFDEFDDVNPQPETVGSILAERGKRYGEFVTHAEITQDLKVAMGRFKGTEPWTNLAPDQREALEMIAHKIGRILNGDPDWADSWADIAGYAQLVADRLQGVVR